MIYKRYKKRPGSQAKSFNFLIPTPNIVKNLESYMRDLSHKELELLKYFFWMDLHHDVIYSSQQHIATHLGVCRQYVNKMIKKFCDDGVIGKVYRHLRTCVYTISPFFRSRSTRDRLSDIFSVFKRSYLWVLLLKATQVLNIYINRDKVVDKELISKVARLERYKKRMEYQKQNRSANDFYKKRHWESKSDGEVQLNNDVEPVMSSYQRMLLQREDVPTAPRRKVVGSAYQNKQKLESAAKEATGFAKMLLNKYMPKFLVGTLDDK